MTITLRAEPLGRWSVPETPAEMRSGDPGAVTEISRFAWEDLTHSLSLAGLLGATEIRLGLDVQPDAIDEDGSLNTTHIAADRWPGVRVSFQCRHGLLVFHSDRFREWRLNVVEIAGLLEALAECDDYSAGGRQYAGWTAAAVTPAPEAAEPMTPAKAAAVLITLAGLDGEDPDELLASPAKIRRAFLLAEHREDLTGGQRAELRELRGVLAGAVMDEHR